MEKKREESCHEKGVRDCLMIISSSPVVMYGFLVGGSDVFVAVFYGGSAMC